MRMFTQLHQTTSQEHLLLQNFVANKHSDIQELFVLWASVFLTGKAEDLFFHFSCLNVTLFKMLE